MRIWRNLDPNLAQLLIQASECLKARNAERQKHRPLGARQPKGPARSASGAVKPAEDRHV